MDADDNTEGSDVGKGDSKNNSELGSTGGIV